MTEIAADSRAFNAPTLPEESDYDPRTRRWWNVWATSPQTTRFAATDWQRLIMLAPLVDKYWRDPDKQLLSEIRLNESLLGATTIDRLRLRWEIVEPDKPRSRIDEFRDREELRRRRLRVTDPPT